jgi:hypothetical protein
MNTNCLCLIYLIFFFFLLLSPSFQNVLFSKTPQCLFLNLTVHQLPYLLTYLLTYLLAAWSRVLLEKLTGLQLVKKFPAFYGTQRFITAFTNGPTVLILSQLNPVHTPTFHFLNIHLNIILPSTPGSPKWSLSLRFPHQKPEYASLLPHTWHSRFHTHAKKWSFWIVQCASCLEAFAKLPKAIRFVTSACPSVYQNRTPRLPLDRNFMKLLSIFRKFQFH